MAIDNGQDETTRQKKLMGMQKNCLWVATPLWRGVQPWANQVEYDNVHAEYEHGVDWAAPTMTIADMEECVHSVERHLCPEILSSLQKIMEKYWSVIIGAVTDGKANPMTMVFSLVP